MKISNVNQLLKTLIDIPSITGDEAEIGNFISDYLAELGFVVERIPVEGKRINVWAKKGKPKVVLQAHIDVVPPFISSSENETYVFGRGACDTKGPVASMIMAAQNALSQEKTDFGLLFTVGEEIDFAGAKKAQTMNELQESFLIVGEPTDLKPVIAHYGLMVFSIICTGKTAHSSEPQRGENAIDKLLDLLNGTIKQLKVEKDTLMSLVTISGGIAENVIPDRAEAQFSFRVAPSDMTDYIEKIRQLVGDQATIQVVHNLPPVASAVPASLSFLGRGQSAKYCTELTFLKKGIVFGPGSVADAHTSSEKILKKDLLAAVKTYEQILREYKA